VKTVVYSGALLDAVFPDARIHLQRGVETMVTDDQAEILLTNPDVKIVNKAKPFPVASPVAVSVPIKSDAPDEVK
jgi:hypothetical protein